MSLAPASIPQVAYLLKVVGGPNKGSTYKLVTGKATIGRDTGNDINFDDPRCSHHHMAILIQSHQIFVKDMGSRNGILLNGEKVTESVVKLGDQIQIGDSIFVIQKESPNPVASSTNHYSAPANASNGLKTIAANKDSKSFPKLIGAILLVVAGFLLFNQGGKKKNADYGLRTEEQVNAELADIEKRKTELARQKVQSAQLSEQGKEAQAAYLQGFRDYREGNYSRAIQSFTAALALLPDHTLAQQYKKLSERRLDELVQFNLSEGKRNMEQNRYEMARSNYRNVLILLNDQTNKLYQEANGQLQIIELLLTGRY